MVNRCLTLGALGACCALAACATIVHSGPRAVAVDSTPPGAKVSIYDRSNTLVQMNTTPFVAQLPTKYGYFKSQTYRLAFDMPGYMDSEVDVDSSLSGWYFGNLAFGGLIGMLIVDPLTGAMFNLTPERITQRLTVSRADTISDRKAVRVILALRPTEGDAAALEGGKQPR
jgi:hypothetical protein